MMKVVLFRAENIVRKGENAGYQHVFESPELVGKELRKT